MRLFSTRLGSTETRTLDLPPGKLLAISRRASSPFCATLASSRFFASQGPSSGPGWKGRRARHSRKRPGGRLVSRRQATRRRPRGRGKSPAGISDWQEALRDRSADQQLADLPGRRLDRLLRGVAKSRGGRACFRRPPTSPVRGLVSQRRRARLVRGRPRDLVHAQKQVRDSSPPLLAVTLSGKLREVLRGPGQLRLFDIAPDGRVLLARWDVNLGVRGSSPPRVMSASSPPPTTVCLSDLSSDGRHGALLRPQRALPSGDGRLASPAPGRRLRRDARLSPDGKWVLAVSSEAPAIRCSFRSAPETCVGSRRPSAKAWSGSRTESGSFARSPRSGRNDCLPVIELASGKATEIKIAASAAATSRRGMLRRTEPSWPGSDAAETF